MTLLLAKESYNRSRVNDYIGGGEDNHYKDSELHQAMDGAYATLDGTREQVLVESRELEGRSANCGQQDYNEDRVGGETVDEAYFWPLSVSEANSLDQSVRRFDTWWWLRSPGDIDLHAAFVNDDGDVNPGGNIVELNFGIRPAFRLNLESVIFTSAAAGGKSASPDETSGDGVGSHLSGTKVSAAADTLKFTIQDDANQTLSVTGVTNISNGTGELQFHYTEAETGENQYISCVLVKEGNDSSTVEYYGKLAELKDESSQKGTVTISLDGVEAGDYTLKLFSEQDNGEYNTDYAGSIHEYPLKVASGKGTIGGGLGSDNSQKVYYGHNEMENYDGYSDPTKADADQSPIAWRIMKNDETTLTLLSDKLLGQRIYDQSGYQEWESSDIAYYLNGKDNYQGEGFIDNSFDLREKDQIEKYGTTETTNGHTDIDISQRIVLPSYEEIYNDGDWFKNDSERIASYADKVELASGAGWWWLRSPGDFDVMAACVDNHGYVPPSGRRVEDNLYGIRPAFRLNLESVILTSAAKGGKSASPDETSGDGVGSSLVGTTVPIGDITLTLQDDTVTAPVITMESEDAEKVLKFQYSGSKPAEYQYISCILADEDGEEPFYYGKLAEPVSDQGDFKIDLKDIPEGTYTMKIFWEECHEDYETDYASQSVECTLKVLSSGKGVVEEDLVPPEIQNIQPAHEAKEVPLSGEIQITFNEHMDMVQEGPVILKSDQKSIELTGGNWTADQKNYTVEYADLDYEKDYIIEVSGFRDFSGNIMKPDSTNMFTTEKAVDAEEPQINTHPSDAEYEKDENAEELVVKADDLSDAGELFYQWYRNPEDKNEDGELLAEETGESYKPPTAEVGIMYYYVEVTNKNEQANREKEISVTSQAAKIKVREKMPQAVIDYENELLTGLENTAYLFGESRQPVNIIDGTYAIVEDWMTGEELSIIRKSDVTGCDSAAQELTIPERPEEPEVTVTPVSSEGMSDGAITGTSTALEYSTDDGDSWEAFIGTTIEGLPAGKYQVRVKAGNETFAGEIAHVTVGTTAPAVNAEKPVIQTQPGDITDVVGSTAETLLTVEINPVLDGGQITYQWYSNTKNSTEGGSLLTNEIGKSYKFSTEHVGIRYYYVVITNTNEDVNGNKTASITSDAAKVTIREKTPQAGINYVEEELTGLEPGSYLVGADSEEITVSGTTYPIDAAWMTGNALTIIRKSTVAGCSSDAQSLVIPKRPSAPTVAGVDTSVKGTADGKITGTSSAMEYSADNGKIWNVCAGDTVESLPAGLYLVRVKADNKTKTFCGESATVTIGEGAAIPDSRLSVEAISFDTIREGAARPAAKNIVISNQGSQDVQLKEVTVSGSTFVILSSDQKTVAAGESNTSWQIQPVDGLKAGLYQETITVTDSNQKKFTAAVSIRVNQILEMEGNAVVGNSFKVTPSAYDSTGTWSYDKSLLSAEIGEGYAVFTPILDGETEILYQSGSGVTGSLKLSIQKGKLTGIAAEGWSGKYDGEPHTITLSGVPEGASVEYLVDSGASWQKQNPSYTEEGTEVTVQYRVTKAGYESATGQAVIRIGDCDHQWSDWKETREASCEANGEQQRECQICNEIQIKEIPSTGHSWGEEQIEPAACEKNGYTYRLCKNCGEVQNTGILMRLPHEYDEWEVTEKPGCETPGSQKHTCKNCGTSESEPIPPTGHDLGDWYTAKAPTETETGLRQRDCKNCDYQETEIIEKLGVLVITGLPENNKIAVGESFTLIPSDDSRKGSDGWKWDPEYFDATFNSPATFTAKKAGITEISYTAEDGRVTTLSISIEEAPSETKETETESEKGTETEKETKNTKGGDKTKKTTVKTGDSSPAVLGLLLLISISGITGMVSYIGKKKRIR